MLAQQEVGILQSVGGLDFPGHEEVRGQEPMLRTRGIRTVDHSSVENCRSWPSLLVTGREVQSSSGGRRARCPTHGWLAHVGLNLQALPAVAEDQAFCNREEVRGIGTTLRLVFIHCQAHHTS
jgi:hypothetical protein